MVLKTDSEATSLAASSPSRSPRRPFYYVMSPQPDPEKMSYNGSTPNGSPPHHPAPHYRLYQISSEIDHSRESATNPFSAPLKRGGGSWNKIAGMRPIKDGDYEDDYDYDDGLGSDRRFGVGCYFVLFVLGFVVLFSFFSLILWGASKSYKPQIYVKSVVFEFYNVQAGLDEQNVPTKMLSINSTVKMYFRNPATFFGVHVTSSPWEFYYSQLKVASGEMKEFYEPRKAQRFVTVIVAGSQIPLYGGGSALKSGPNEGPPASVPLKLVFRVQAQANVLGRLVKSNFYRSIHCSVHLMENRLGKPVLYLNKKCEYSD